MPSPRNRAFRRGRGRARHLLRASSTARRRRCPISPARCGSSTTRPPGAGPARAHGQDADRAEKHLEFGDKVVFIACNVDQDKDRLVKHLETKGWNKTHNVWDDDRENDAYGVTGIPTVFIIDADGKIAASGHPGTMDIGEIVTKLLAGKKE
ncbi:MAG: thioredoxin-like domain-containing protein [Kiritimatiellia bacterium]